MYPGPSNFVCLTTLCNNMTRQCPLAALTVTGTCQFPMCCSIYAAQPVQNSNVCKMLLAKILASIWYRSHRGVRWRNDYFDHVLYSDLSPKTPNSTVKECVRVFMFPVINDHIRRFQSQSPSFTMTRLMNRQPKVVACHAVRLAGGELATS